MATPLSEPRAYLLFTAPRPDRAMARKTRLRCWAARTFNGEDDYHIVACHDGVAMNYHPEGLRFWPLVPFVEMAPDLTVGLTIPLARKVDLTPYEKLTQTPISGWKTVVSYFGGGYPPVSGNCLWLARDLLERGGVAVPAYLTTPSLLKEYLIARGHPSASLV